MVVVAVLFHAIKMMDLSVKVEVVAELEAPEVVVVAELKPSEVVVVVAEAESPQEEVELRSLKKVVMAEVAVKPRLHHMTPVLVVAVAG